MREIIDLDRFPLDHLDSKGGQALLRRCRDELDREGLFNLSGFVPPQALERMIAEISPPLKMHAFTHKRVHNIYFLPGIPHLPSDHPALRRFETINHTICSDQIPSSLLIKLYRWPPFAAFLAEVMNKSELYVMADPLACVNVMAYRDGEALNWHFDRSEFTTTLLLQSPDGGGDFQYRTGLRSDDDPNYDGVGRFLESGQDEVSTLPLTAGTLNVFRGKNTAHRVTPVRGGRERIVTVFSYYEQAGVKFSEQERIGFYGRAK